MKKIKNLDKYTYRIEWSEADHAHIAKCLEFPSLATHGDSPEEALKEIENVVAETILWLREEQQPIPQPLGLRKFKGNLTLHIPPELHRALAIKSSEEGVSINQYILSKL